MTRITTPHSSSSCLSHHCLSQSPSEGFPLRPHMSRPSLGGGRAQSPPSSRQLPGPEHNHPYLLATFHLLAVVRIPCTSVESTKGHIASQRGRHPFFHTSPSLETSSRSTRSCRRQCLLRSPKCVGPVTQASLWSPPKHRTQSTKHTSCGP